MSFKKITDSELSGKGVIGMADVPGLTAAEMQAKIEEVVRDVVIPNINDNVDEIEDTLATKEELAEAVFESGSVSSVFGRAGAVVAQSGDYTPAQVGAAPAVHTHTVSEVTDFPATMPPSAHAHGNIANDGKIGSTNGLVVMTGVGGALEAVAKNQSGFVQEANTVSDSAQTVSFTVADNTEYRYTGVKYLTMTGANVRAHGFITFGNFSSGITVNVSGFTAVKGDDIDEAKKNEIWEFDCDNGCCVFVNWSDT